MTWISDMTTRITDTTGIDRGRLAIDAGYHDQAHFNREAARLEGRPPGEIGTREACRKAEVVFILRT